MLFNPRAPLPLHGRDTTTILSVDRFIDLFIQLEKPFHWGSAVAIVAPTRSLFVRVLRLAGATMGGISYPPPFPWGSYIEFDTSKARYRDKNPIPDQNIRAVYNTQTSVHKGKTYVQHRSQLQADKQACQTLCTH